MELLAWGLWLCAEGCPPARPGRQAVRPWMCLAALGGHSRARVTRECPLSCDLRINTGLQPGQSYTRRTTRRFWRRRGEHAGAVLCESARFAPFARYVQPPMISFDAIFEQSTPNSPIVFILSPGSDPASDLLKLAERSGFGGNRLKFLAMGQGQEKVITCWKEQALNLGEARARAQCLSPSGRRAAMSPGTGTLSPPGTAGRCAPRLFPKSVHTQSSPFSLRTSLFRIRVVTDPHGTATGLVSENLELSGLSGASSCNMLDVPCSSGGPEGPSKMGSLRAASVVPGHCLLCGFCWRGPSS